MKDYKAAPGNWFGIDDDEAALIGAELDEIAAVSGSLTSKAVYDFAKDHPNAVLSGYVLDCDAEEAADRYYIDRAGRLIRSVKITVIVNESPVNVPYRVSVVPPQCAPGSENTSAAEPREYVETSVVMASKDLSAQAKRNLFRWVFARRNEFSLYPEFAGLVRELDKLEDMFA